MKKHLLLSGILLSSLFANNGKEVYTIYCAACHGAEGQGVKGAAPPLSNSEWVAGDPGRMIQVLIKGMMGPVNVKGVKYNLVMPPQAALNDQQVTDTVNYVRSNWGNTGAEVNLERVLKEKEKSKNKIDMWNQATLLKQYPLTNKRTKLKGLICESFPAVDSFSKLESIKPLRVEEENSGAINLNQGGKSKRAFTARWSGSLTAPKAGEYTFSLLTGGVTKLVANGETLFEFSEKQTVPSSASITLPKGEFDLELFYKHKAKEDFKLELYWSGENFHLSPLHDTSKPKPKPVHILKPSSDRALVHRNFFRKEHGRELAVGFASKQNFIFCTEKLNMRAIWHGGFLDVGPAWDGRAINQYPKPQAELTNLVDDLPYTISNNKLTSWTKGDSKFYRFNGYEYDQNGNPTFNYQVVDTELSDHFSSSDDGKTLTRTISAQNAPQGKTLFFKILPSFKKQDGDTFEVDSKVNISITPTPTVLEDKSVILPVGNAPVTITYRWK